MDMITLTLPSLEKRKVHLDISSYFGKMQGDDPCGPTPHPHGSAFLHIPGRSGFAPRHSAPEAGCPRGPLTIQRDA